MSYNYSKDNKLYPEPVDYKLYPEPVDYKLYPEPVDYKLYPEPVDYKTSWGKGFIFNGVDDNGYATPEEAQQANKEYWESQQNPSKRHR